MHLIFQNVAFSYDRSLNPLFVDADIQFPVGWTGIIGANGVGKTTLLLLASGQLTPSAGVIHSPGKVIYCPQRTDNQPADFSEFMTSMDSDACILRSRLHIDNDWVSRWQSLSHGERKKIQIAAALWKNPNIIALDEPANHIDADTRNLLMDVLAKYKGIGLLVSHDRNMLDTLCSQCVYVDPPSIGIYQGGYTKTIEQVRANEEQMHKERDLAKTKLIKLEKEVNRRKAEAGRSDSKKSKRHISIHDNDAKGKIDLARVTGKDGAAGRLANQLSGRMRQAEEQLLKSKVKKRYKIDFWLPSSVSTRNTLFDIPAGTIDFGNGHRLEFPNLSMLPDDRIAVTGANGTGKSTLIRHIIQNLNLPHDKVVYLPQEIDLSQSYAIMDEVNSLSHEKMGEIMTKVSSLGSRPGRLVGSENTSPGEIRKILLALGVSKAPHLIIMDEPTNHLDIPAIECLENALGKCPCGLLLVSHDERFLSKLAKKEWYLSPVQNGMFDVISLKIMNID